MRRKSRENQDNWSIIKMEFETYEEVIDSYNSGVGVEPGDTLTDYIKKNNIKIKEIDMSPMKDLKDALSKGIMDSDLPQSKDIMDSDLPQSKGIMETDEAKMMMAEGPMQIGSDDVDPFLLEEYEKYRFDMLEQGLEPMSLEQFRREALAGMAKAEPEEVEEIKERKVISLAGGGIPELLEG